MSRAVSLLVMVLAGVGCQSRGRPFDDVVRKDRDQASVQQEDAVASATPQAPVPGSEAEAGPAAAEAAPPQSAPLQQKSDSAASAPALAVGEDGALRRPWSLSVCQRPSGDVAVWPVYYATIPEKPAGPDWLQPFVEPAVFMIDTILLPVRAVLQPPWRRIVQSPAGDRT